MGCTLDLWGKPSLWSSTLQFVRVFCLSSRKEALIVLLVEEQFTVWLTSLTERSKSLVFFLPYTKWLLHPWKLGQNMCHLALSQRTQHARKAHSQNVNPCDSPSLPCAFWLRKIQVWELSDSHWGVSVPSRRNKDRTGQIPPCSFLKHI